MPPGPILRRLSPLDDEERRAAIADPGPTWREYFFHDFLKAWIFLGFFVVDSWIAVSWIHPLFVPGLLGSLALAVYLEILGFRALYYRPKESTLSAREEFHPTWLRPLQYGRWTPEGERVRAGLPPFGRTPTSAGPDPSEFI